eukprot:1169258-Amphidinium_carterae.1
MHRKLQVIVTVHVNDPIVAGTSQELKVKENPAWSAKAQIFLGANFSRLTIVIDGITKEAIVEGSKPGYFQNTLIQAGMEKGSAVGTAGVKSVDVKDTDLYTGEEDHK